MSEFNQELKRAAARQHRIFFFSLLVIILLVVSVGGFTLFVKGTPIRVAPAEIEATAELEVINGMAMIVDGTLFSLSRNPKIKTAAQGFAVDERVITAEQEGTQQIIELVPLPGQIILTTDKENPAAEWFVDGKPVSLSKDLDLTIEAGRYTISVDPKYYLKESLDIDVGRGEVVQQIVAMRELTVPLKIETIPGDALIEVDGISAGKSPLISELSGGKHQFVIRKDGYATTEELLEVTNKDETVSRKYRLKIEPAYVTIDITPKGGQLTLNGKPVKHNTKISVAPSRSYDVKYVKPGFFGQEKSVKVASGTTEALVFALKTEIGNVTISSTPSAVVIVNGQPVGETPVNLRLQAIPHRVQLVREGYRLQEKKVTPSAARDVRWNADLLTIEAAKKSEAKKTYVNAVGMQMKLFKPTAFVMGAPRHETGQRANEFVKQVTLDRYFYASRREVTQRQFAAFKPSASVAAQNIPVTNVSWLEAAQFCNWLSVQEGLKPFYKFSGNRFAGYTASANGYRLLSEAEWEWLARKAGRQVETRFPWGNDPVIPTGSGNIADESARGKTRFYVPDYDDSFAGLAPVGSFDADQSGLNDLFGNVSEWVNDYYSLTPPAKGETFKNPLGGLSGDKHVIKGSNWQSGTLTELRPSYRDAGDEGRKNVGFRIGRYL
ncbi:MAG: SUMF1/EgtB/PvdO family nonheme iron enzyme [Sneathiella sp.]|uniref:SUMF1/EgtB/PvdO family nonheme iron enzyme n=1 Tax=Sneathiella sp. TaxID=1964365 RepID=UPI0030023782